MKTGKRCRIPTLFVACVLMVAGCGVDNTVAAGSPSAPGASAPVPNRPAGTVQPSTPFAGLPFSKREVGKDLRMTSGWYIAEDEQGVVGRADTTHQALDFEGPLCGTPVRAIADGVAVASFQSGAIRGGKAPYNPADPANSDTDWKDPFNGRSGFLGYSGLFVELQTNVKIPGAQNAVAQYFHLGKVNPKITWLNPMLTKEPTWKPKEFINKWDPTRPGESITQSQTAIRSIATEVKRGDIIGWLGDTGINFGYNDRFDPVTHTVDRSLLERVKNPPWDPQGAGVKVPLNKACQLHIEFYSGRDAAGQKIGRFDGFDMYDRIQGEPGTRSYVNPDNPRPGKFVMGPQPIFERDARGDAVYATP